MTYLSPEWREQLIAAMFPENELVIGCSDEILPKLPPYVMIDGETLYLDIMDDRDWIGDTSWDLGYSKIGMAGRPLHVRSKDSFADACAKMYCRLAERKLLPPA